MRCGIVEKNKPACVQALDGDGICPVHCRAKTQHGPCKKRHKKGRLRCFKHGGKTRKGIAHPNYTEGKYVKQRYKGALTDPEMVAAFEESEMYPDKLSLRKELDLLDMRTALMLGRIQRGEGPSVLRQAQEAFEEFAAKQVSKDRDGALDALQRLGSVLRKGVADEDDWEKVEELAFQRRPKIVEAEIRRQQYQVEVVHIVIVERLLQLVAELIRQHVKDTTAITAIETALVRIADDTAGSLSAPRRLGPRRI